MEEQRVTLFLDNCSTVIAPKLRGEVYRKFKEHLGYIREDAIWAQQSNPNWTGLVTTVCYSRDYCKCAIPKDGMHFPTGVVSKAIEFLKANSIPYQIKDVRDSVVACSVKEMDLYLADKNSRGEPFALYDYQQETVEKAISAQRGIIKIATGGGKTLLAAAVTAILGVKPTIFYVTSKDLLRQAKNEFEQFIRSNGHKITVGAVGGGHKQIADITVMTVQTAVRALGQQYQRFDDEDEVDNTDISDIQKDIVDLIHSAKLYWSDECQHCRAETCQIVADNSLSARWRFGLSATPFRDAGDDILIEACFGKTIADISASFLIERGFLVKPFINFIHVKNFKGQHLGPWPSVYKTALVENGYRNEMIAQLAQNLVDKGRTVLALVTQIHHGEILEDLIPGSIFLHGSTSGKERHAHLEKMRLGHAPVTIASVIFDEGIDVRALDSLILCGGGKSPTRALQRVGRVIRTYTYPDGRVKENAFVYDIYDHQKYLTQHAMARLKMYKTEPEFEIKV